MRYYYAIAYGQPNDRAVWYTGKYTFHGDIYDGNVEEAYRFGSMGEVCAYLVKNPYDAMNGAIVVMIADVTWDRIYQGAKDYKANIQSEYRDLYHKYNHVSYITNSKAE